tara:strand:+ start:163 stop:297 length:135 start_codon:yes stop_codon:yes gene_type:complete
MFVHFELVIHAVKAGIGLEGATESKKKKKKEKRKGKQVPCMALI